MNATATFHSRRFWPAMRLSTKGFLPDKVAIWPDHVRISKRRMWGLRSSVDDVPYEQIASVRVTNRMFTAVLLIETAGGSAGELSVTGLPRGSAAKAAQAIREHMR